MHTLTRRAWALSAFAWLLLAFLQSPGLTSADTKHDLTENPWGFLHQALTPWTDTFPLGQLQNQAYGYLFPHGLFFALFETAGVPGWITQRLWWALLLFLAFAGMVRVVEAWPWRHAPSVPARVLAGVLYALSPRILSNIGAISSEAWVMALVPWILLPVLQAMRVNSRPLAVRYALASAVFILLLGAVNAVATAAAVLPAAIFLALSFPRRQAFTFTLAWVPAGIMACFWWVGPLLILGKYSPPFTDFIESSSLTTRWLNPLEVLRGTTSWVPFLSTERPAGNALTVEPVFIVATLLVALIGLWGLIRMARAREGYLGRTLLLFFVGVLVMVLAVSPLSPVSQGYREFLDGAGAALRNLHKFDPLVRLPLMVGFVYALRNVHLPTLDSLKHPERNLQAVRAIAVSLLFAVLSAPAWSGSLAAADPYKQVPGYWQEATDWLNTNAAKTEPRTLILPEARFGKQTWGNTRDEPAQPLLDVPWAVRDSVPLVQPAAIRGLDGINSALASGRAIPTLASTLRSQGVGYLLVRSDLTTSADTPGATQILRTLDRSKGFQETASFGANKEIRIFATGTPEQVADTGLPQIVDKESIEAVAAAPEALPRLNEADAALGRTASDSARVRVMGEELASDIQTITDTPALRDHNYGNVTHADSAIRAPGDDSNILNPLHDYPFDAPTTRVHTSGGKVRASSTADDPTSFGGAETTSSLTAAVDGHTSTAWRPAPGVASGQWLEFDLDKPSTRLGLALDTQGTDARLHITTYRGEETVASTTAISDSSTTKNIDVPAGEADRIRITILNTFGDFGISEAKVTNSLGEDVTPEREIVVPGGSANRWLFGQETDEGVLRRNFEMPQDTPLVVHSERCDVSVMVDGKDYRCGDTLTLTAGTHVLSTSAPWASLTVAEPLLAAAIAQTPGAEAVGDNRTRFDVPDSDKERVLFLPTQANPGRKAVCFGCSIALEPVVVNGWQQGWKIPAGVSGPIEVYFQGEQIYQLWLLVGLAAAVVLVLLWAGVARWTRGGVVVAADADADAESISTPRWITIPFYLSSAVAVTGAARGPWGGQWYAGDSWVVNIALVVPLLLTVLAGLWPKK